MGYACRFGASNDVLRVILREMVAYKEKGLGGGKRKRDEEQTNGVPFYPFLTTGCEQVDFSVQKLRVLLEEYPEGATRPLEPGLDTLLYRTLTGEPKYNNLSIVCLQIAKNIRFHGKR